MDQDNEKVAANGEISKEIGDINLAYMLLAQKLVKQDRAAAMFRLGVGKEMSPLHTPTYNFVDEALPHGIRILTRAALRYLETRG